MLRYIVSSLLLVLFFSSCVKDSVSDKSSEIPRPHDPWVFRSVLDSMPRMVTIALNENLWAAYSTNNCSLYKVWKGYVSLEGAVYNTHHGPQPLSMGDAYILNKSEKPWSVMIGGVDQLKSAHYKGHKFIDDHVQLMYDLELKDGSIIHITEQPEYAVSESGQTGFERVFEATNLPAGAEVINHSGVASIASFTNVKSTAEISYSNESEITKDDKSTIDAIANIPIKGDAPTKVTTFFIAKPTIKNSRVQAEDEEDLPFGYRLIAQNDCKTCHNVNVKTIGPAYTDIAEKYPTNETTALMLANKIIKGGAGIWGAQVMSAHPELAETDAVEMVRYILSLDTDDNGGVAESGAIAPENYLIAADIDEGSMIPGVATKIYNIPRTATKMPTFTDRDKPIQGGVMPEYNNLGGGDFIGLEDQFALVGEGYLLAEEDGEYVIRVWSDDGSLFSINGQQVVDNDGQHGTEAVDAKVGLKKGYHKFKIEMFDSGGGQFLSLNWKQPNAAIFETVSVEYLYHSIEQQQGNAGLKLPMSVLRKIPGDAFPVAGVHPAYDLKQARPYDFLPKVGGMDFLPDGRLVVCTWDPSGAVYIVDKVETGDPNQMSYKRIASGLAEPLGLKVVDNEIYVLQKQELTRLVDHDGDDMIDEYQLVSNEWKTSANFHEFAFGLEYKDGYFYGTLATAIMPGGASADPQIEDRGKVVKISKDNGTVEFIASGLRTPNGIGMGVDGELFVCDNQGDWLPSSKMVHIKEGAWYGSRSVDFEGTANLTETQPVVWLPQDEIGNSPSAPLYINDGPYKGQMIHGEVTHGGVKRDFIEKVNGQYQGALFRFTQGLEAGVNRMVWGPDGALYVGGIGNPGNWQTSGSLWYGLQKLKYNGKSAFEMLAIRAKSNGLEIEFTEPLREGDGWSASDYDIQQWKYVPTIEYGGPKVDLEKLSIRSVNISDDRKRVFLELAGMKKKHMLYVHLINPFISAEDHGLWSYEGWYNMNEIPSGENGFVSATRQTKQLNALTETEKTAGWELLFDGKTTSGWTNFNKETIGSSWKVSNGELYLETKRNEEGKSFAPEGGDIVTAKEYENFEFEIEWKISNCGNSGIMFVVKEDAKYDHPWLTGPELQILDNSCHPDTRYPTHRAGDLYDMIECKYVTVRPAGEWNKIRLVKKDGKVQHWQNGQKVVEYEMYTEKWNDMIANSKFKDMPDFGQSKAGKISLQDHGDKISFRNIKIREL